jgi:hypothetical protein
MWPGIVVLVGILFWLGFIFGKDHDPAWLLSAPSSR